MELDVLVSEVRRTKHGGNSEPYKGFFSDKGLLYKKIDNGWDTLPRWDRSFEGVRSFYRRLSVVQPKKRPEWESIGEGVLAVWPKVALERGFYVQTPENLGIKIPTDSRGLGYLLVNFDETFDTKADHFVTINSVNELTEMENAGMTTEEAVRKIIAPYTEKGCKSWYGTMLTVVTGSSIQHVEMGTEMDALKKAVALEQFAVDKAKEIYGTLDQQKVEQYGTAMNEGMATDLKLDEEHNPFESLRGAVKIFTVLPIFMLRNHNRAAKKAGLLAADKELYSSVKKYCKDNALPVAYQKQGKKVQKWLLKESLEDREHFIYHGESLGMAVQKIDLRDLPLEELERVPIPVRRKID